MSDPQALQKEIERLRASVDELAALNEIATAIGSSQSLEDVNDRIVRMVVKRARATQGAIFLLSEKEERPMETVVRVKDSSVDEDPARFGLVITGRVVKEQAPLNISRDKDPDDLLSRMPEFVRSVLSVPMKARGKFVGVLSVFNKRGADEFSIDDQRFLSILAAQSVQIIERIRYVDVEKDLAALRKELSVARDIQASFLPGEFPSHPEYDIFAQYTPAEEVGGDSFDVIQTSRNKIIITQGDVTGHGVPAALMMAGAQTAIRCKLEGYLDG
ncbi:MAG: PP2C family protein-serine/threonine phosphatase [Candidatus Zixiibacteriota bacterium]